jgi:hypothetical protein
MPSRSGPVSSVQVGQRDIGRHRFHVQDMVAGDVVLESIWAAIDFDDIAAYTSLSGPTLGRVRSATGAGLAAAECY